MSRKITVNASKSYDVLIDGGCLAKCGEMLLEYFRPCSVCIVSDTNVAPIYMNTVKSSLETSGFAVNEFVFPAGEESKSPSTLLELWRHLASVPMTRSDMLIALGGGVTGDLTGFAAATYLRGVKYVQIPTSLLAMVDSSVGGKTAIDLPEGKNLCGAFCQPSLVICDTECLDTLPKKEYSCGMAEVIKYAMIDRPIIFDLIEKNDIEALIYECIDDKREKVEADECDNGVRQLLNLGHTLGHAIEKLEGFKTSHGEAVAIGMTLITRYAVTQNMCSEADLVQLISALKKYDLPTKTQLSASEIAGAAMGDKKRKGNTVTLVIPRGKLGSMLVPTSTSDMEGIVEAALRKDTK